MEFVYAVQNEKKLEEYRRFAEIHGPVLEEYLGFLRREYEVTHPPRAIVLADEKTATRLLSDTPLPAYTNDVRVVFCPDAETWKGLYLRQLPGYPPEETGDIRAHYEAMGNNHILQILGHELAHHSELFSDEAWETGDIWFEEGMAEYISRRYFLTEREFEAEARINRRLLSLYETRRPPRPWQRRGPEDGDMADLFYDYWRAFFRVSALIDARGGDVRGVMERFALN